MELRGSDVLEWNTAKDTAKRLIEGKNPTLGMLIMCGINFGLRIGDLLPITWEQIRQDAFIIHEQKTGKPRKIIVNGAVRETASFLDQGQSGPIFTSQKGTVYSQQHVNRLLKKHFGRGFSSHGLRKTFGKRLYERTGRDLAKVQLQLNHSDPKHTLRYIGITQQQMDECFSLIE